MGMKFLELYDKCITDVTFNSRILLSKKLTHFRMGMKFLELHDKHITDVTFNSHILLSKKLDAFTYGDEISRII